MSSQNDSIKTPVVYLYNEAGELLTSSIESLDLGIVDFTYEYDDEEEDVCIIRIQAKHHDAIDSLNIRRNAQLFVKWGYLGGPLSFNARVAVRDISSKYGTNIIYTEYKCTDLSTYLRLVRSEDVQKMSILKYLDNYASRMVNIVIQSGPDIIYKQSIQASDEARKEEDLLSLRTTYLEAYGANPEPFDPFVRALMNGQKPSLPKVHSTEVQIKGNWYVDSENDIRKYIEQERDMVSTNRSPYNLLQEYLNCCPNGPWFITGRGNTLLIHNRNLGNRLYKNYIYAGENGELMDFTAETKYENFEQQKISSLSMDPATKDVNSLDAYLTRLNNQRTFIDIINDRSITKEERDKQLKEFVIGYHDYKLYEIKINEFRAYTRANPNISNYQDAQISFSAAAINGDVSFDEDSGLLAKKAQTDVIYLPPGQLPPLELQGYMGKVLIYSIPVDDPLDSAREQSNILRKLEMETEEASIIVEGDPNLKSEMVVGILNVQQTHEGKYYIKKCTHNITEQGFRTSLETLKVKDQAVIKSLKSQTQIDKSKEAEISLKLPEFFLKQEKAFRRWNIEVKWERWTSSATLDNTAGMMVEEVATLDQILSGPSSEADEQFAVIKKYIDDPKYKLHVKERLITDPGEL